MSCSVTDFYSVGVGNVSIPGSGIENRPMVLMTSGDKSNAMSPDEAMTLSALLAHAAEAVYNREERQAEFDADEDDDYDPYVDPEEEGDERDAHVPYSEVIERLKRNAP